MKTLLLFSISFALFIFTYVRLSNFSEPLVKKDAALDMKMFPLWDLEEAMSSFGRLNDEEKEIYRRFYTEGYDILFPIFYTIFISYTFYILNSSTNKLPQYTLVVSIVTLISDLLENFCVYHILAYYPDRQLIEPYARMGRFFTGVKTVTLLTMTFLILVSLGFWLRQFLSSRTKSKTS